jgi:hypothetical protein
VILYCSYVQLNGSPDTSKPEISITLPDMSSPWAASYYQTSKCPSGTFVQSFQTRYGCGQDALALYCGKPVVDCTGQSLLCY